MKLLKEMQYNYLDGAITLDHSTYRDYEYLIVNFGSYPAAYVRIPEGHPYYEKEFWNMKIKPHSDLSFGGTLEKYHLEGFWVGWAYNLFGDFVYGRTSEFITDGWHKKYTTEDIISKIHDVINLLIEYANKENDLQFRKDIY